MSRARGTGRRGRAAESAPGAPSGAPLGTPASSAGAATGRPGARLAVEASLVLLAMLLAIYRTRERDFWFHLAAGRSIVEHGIPSTERWCLAAFGQWPWLGEWLYHVSLYAVRSCAGDAGVALWRALWSALAMAFALALGRSLRAGVGGLALLAPIVLAIVRGRLAARPEQLSLALLLLFLVVFERARQGGRDRTAWLLPIQVLWVNLHPGWLLGPLVAGLYAALEALRPMAGRGRRALRWAVLGLALYGAGALSPQPLDTLSLRLMRDVRADPMMVTIEELRSWSWTEDHAQPFSALVALAVAAAALGGRRAWRASPPLSLAALAGLAAGLVSFRFRALGAVTALPVLATALAPHWPPPFPFAGTAARNGHGGRAARLGAALALLAAGAGVVWLLADQKYFPPGAAPLLDSVPVRAVALADSLRLDGPVLNTTEFGGYILWTRGERHLPIADTRHLGSAEFRSRFVRARLDPAALDTLLSEWRFTYAVLEPPMDPLDHLAVQLFHHPGWALVCADDAGLLFVRRDVAPALAAARAYRLLTPDYGEMGALATRAQADSTLERLLTAELLRERAESRWNGRANLWLGLLALGHRRARAALDYFDQVERVAPVTPGLALRQGYARELLGDETGAVRAYRRALRDTADVAAAREALARLRH